MFDTLSVLTVIGRHYQARGWYRRLTSLRRTYANAQAGEELGGFALFLLETLQLPPFDRVLEMRPRGSRCPVCPQRGVHEGGAVFTVAIIEDRARHRCGTCGANWLEPA